MNELKSTPVGLPRDGPTVSYWQDPADDIADLRTSKQIPQEVDVVIIGSGISGASIAHNLLTEQPDLNVLMLEARQAASGASGRNGGHTKTASYRAFLDNLEAHSEEEAVKIAHLEYNCMAAVHEFIKANEIDCDSRRLDTLDIFYSQKQWDNAHKAVDRIRKSMDGPAAEYKFYDSAQTEELWHCPNAIGSLKYPAGSLSAYKLTVGILNLALSKGLQLWCNTAAQSISEVDSKDSTNRWRVSTREGDVVSKQVVLATNGYTAHLLPELQGIIVPFRGLVQAHMPGAKCTLPEEGLTTTYSFVYEKGYEYMIQRPKGTKFEYDIVIGGGLTKCQSEGLSELGTTDDTTYNPEIADYLTQTTPTYFGKYWGDDTGLGKVRKTWSGIMGYSADGHPLVGPVPGRSGLFLDASFQGHGMVLCFLCAKAVTKMILADGEAEIDDWFPRSFLVSEERMNLKFPAYRELIHGESA